MITPELAELVGLDKEEGGRFKAGTVLFGFRLQRVGPTPRKGQPDRRAWLLGRVDAVPEGADADSVNTSLPAEKGMSAKRAPGFVPCIDAEATVMGRLELPRRKPSVPALH